MSTVVTQTPVVLDEDSDYIPWLEVIQTAADKFQLWDYVNPKIQPGELKVLEIPVEPTPKSLRTPVTPAAEGVQAPTAEISYSDLTAAERTQLQLKQNIYLHDLRTYDKKMEAMGDLRARIQSTISRRNFQYTRNCKSVAEMLRSLHVRFAPSDQARRNEVTKAWHLAIQRPKRGTAITKWLHDLESAYDEAVDFDLPEVKGLHPHFALTSASLEIDSSFANDWDRKLLKIDEKGPNKPDFREMVKELRDLRRLRESRTSPAPRHGAFQATFQGMDSEGTPTQHPCLCGTLHKLSTCYYIIPEKRPSGWKPNHAIQQKVDDAISKLSPKSYKFQKIRRFQEEAKTTTRPNPMATPSHQSGSTNTDSGVAKQNGRSGGPSSFMVHGTSVRPIKSGAFSIPGEAYASDYSLRNSVILDSGSTCNIGNQRDRFDGLRPPRNYEDNFIFAGDALVPIEAYGTLSLTIQTDGFPNGRVVTFSNTPFVPTFHTSVISLKFLNRHGIYWDNRSNTLVYGDEREHWADTPILFD